VRLLPRPELAIWLWVVLGALVGGCTVCINEQWPDITVPATPANDAETLVGKALRHVVLEDNDMPGYHLIEGKSPTVLCDRVGGLDEGLLLSPGALPSSDEARFVLLTPTQLRRLAFCRGGFAFVSILALVVGESEAEVTLCVQWYPSLRDDGKWPPGVPHYTLRYRRDGSAWVLVGTERGDPF
jgi:hypothetical protein